MPDVKVGANFLSWEAFAGTEDVDEWGGSIDFRLDFLWARETGRFVITPRYRTTRYPDNDSLERENQGVRFGWTETYPTAELSISADVSRMDLVSSELGDIGALPGEGSVGEEDSGIVGDGERDRISFVGEWVKHLTRRGGIVLGINYLDNSYDDTGPVARNDFSEGLGHLGWRWQPSSRSAWTFTGGARRYEGDNGVDVDSSRFQALFEYDLSELTVFRAGVGYEDLEGTQDSVLQGTDDSIPFEIGITKTAQLATYTAELARYVFPISTGRFEERTRLTLLVERNLSERLTGSFGVIAYRGEPLDIDPSAIDRDFVSGRMQLYWALTRTWFVGVELYHSQQEFIDTDTNVQDRKRTEVFLNIRYKGSDPTKI